MSDVLALFDLAIIFASLCDKEQECLISSFFCFTFFFWSGKMEIIAETHSTVRQCSLILFMSYCNI